MSWVETRKTSDLNDYLEEIYKLSDVYNDEFISKIAEVAKHYTEDTVLKKILNEDKNSDHVRLMAFYGLCVKYRRMRDYTDFEKLLKDWCQFQSYELYKYQRMVFLKTKYSSNEDLEIALSIWNQLNEQFKKLPGVIQGYGDLVAKLFENEALTCEKVKDNNIREDAINKMRFAIEKKSYAKFYATLGRLYAAGKHYNKGIEYIKTAIDKESSKDSDYALRVNDYQSYIIQIQVKKLYEEESAKIDIQKLELEKIKDAVEKSKYDSLAFLGFFVALISFIFGSFTILGDSEFVERIQIILVLCGSILIAFSSLRFMIKTIGENVKDAIYMISLGAILIFFALLIVPKII